MNIGNNMENNLLKLYTKVKSERWKTQSLVKIILKISLKTINQEKKIYRLL